MEENRNKIKQIILDNLCIQFKDHNALSTLDSYNATVKLVDGMVDNVVEKILNLVYPDRIS